MENGSNGEIQSELCLSSFFILNYLTNILILCFILHLPIHSEEKYHEYMMSYSPMNTVQKGKKYPACWLTGGLHDPRVAYWEPAKFAATLRDANPDNEYPFCMKLDLSAGKSALVFFMI